jgi:purine-nucleoside phosphorylase
MDALSVQVEQAAEYIREQWLADKAANPAALPLQQPQVAIITGSGLGALAERIEQDFSLPYSEIPHFSAASMPGHEGQLVFGRLGGKRVACMQGRLHTYQGYTPLQTVLPLLVSNALGAKTLVVANAAGAINRGFSVGQIMLITDHINFTGQSPITFNQRELICGDNLDMTFAYTPALQELAVQAAKSIGCNLASGVYLGLRGAMFETPAEIKMFAGWGADAIGMSTVHEVIAASRLSMQVLGLSLISNMAAGILPGALSADDVINISKQATTNLADLIEQVLAGLVSS